MYVQPRHAVFPAVVVAVLGATHAGRINTLVLDIVEFSEVDTLPGAIVVSPAIRAAADALREFLYERVYTPINENPDTRRAQHIVRTLYTYFLADPLRLPSEDARLLAADPPERVAADFVAAMTDRYAIDLYERLFVPQNWTV